jgi:hypothetical protein
MIHSLVHQKKAICLQGDIPYNPYVIVICLPVVKLFLKEHVMIPIVVVNVLNLHRIYLARKYYTHLQREFEKEEAR